MQDDSIQSQGGKARAEALTPEQRAEIAKKAAAARWDVPKATHRGEIIIGKTRIPCAVLSNGKRVFSENGITNAILGSRSGASKRLKKSSGESGAPVPLFLAPSNLKPFISEELRDGPLKPVVYRDGSTETVGYEADLLPAVCEIWLEARDAGALQDQQLGKAKQAETLTRGLARVGVTALIDEATGYQDVRDRQALAKILESYLMKEGHRRWERMFQLDYYRELFRLLGWSFNPDSTARPSYLGKVTNNVIYDRLLPGLRKKLNDLNPKDEKGNRKLKNTQLFTGDIGIPELKEHLSNVIFLMKASKTYPEFIDSLDRARPKVGDTLKLDL